MKTTCHILAAVFAAFTASSPLPAATEPGTVWKGKAIHPEFENLQSVASNGNGRAVAVGSHGTILVSDDHGATWTRRSIHASIDLNSIAWTGSRFVAAGVNKNRNAVILNSSSGLVWNDMTCLETTSSSQFIHVAAGPDRTVASVSALAYSSELREWSRAVANFDMPGITGIVWDGDQFVAAGYRDLANQPLEGGILTSADGRTWTMHESGDFSLVKFLCVARNDARIVAGGYDTGTHRPLIFVSSDGNNWTKITLGAAPSDFFIRTITWTGERFIAMGSGGIVLSSADGQSWSGMHRLGVPDILGSCWDGTHLIAVGDYGVVCTAPNADPQSGDWNIPASVGTYRVLYDIASGDAGGTERIVVTGSDELVLTSDDGGDSFAKRPCSVGRNHLLGVAYTPLSTMHFFAVGTNGTIATSPNGIDWTPQSTDTTADLNACVWFPSRFPLFPFGIAVGEGGTIVKSGTATGWATQSSPTSNNLRDVATGTIRSGKNGEETQILVAVGEEGTIIHSSNGSHWTNATDTGNRNAFVGVAAGNGTFVAVDCFGGIFVSNDAENWTKVPKIKDFLYLNSVHWTGNQFVALGDYGDVLTSPDGSRWTLRYGMGNMVAATSLQSGRIVAVCLDGMVVASDAEQDFSDWIAAQSPPVGQDGWDDDPNHDGITNGISAVLGISAVSPSGALGFRYLPRVEDPVYGQPLHIHLRTGSSLPFDLSYVIEYSRDLKPGNWRPLLVCHPGQPFELNWTKFWLQVITSKGCGTDMTVVPTENAGAHAMYFVRLRAMRDR